MMLATRLVSELAVAMSVAELAVAAVGLVVTVAAPASMLGVAVELANAVGVRQGNRNSPPLLQAAHKHSNLLMCLVLCHHLVLCHRLVWCHHRQHHSARA